MARKTDSWSYNAGERGKNWVRAYEDRRDGKLYVEWREPVVDVERDERVVGATSGKPKLKRVRLSLAKFGITSRTEAKNKAREMAEGFAQLGQAAPEPLTLDRLLTLYLEEVTPSKGESKQGHDQRAAKLFRAFFDGRMDPKRRMDRPAESLTVTDWNEFIQERKNGLIPGWGPVRGRQIEYDLKFLVAVLAWAEGADEKEVHHLPRNPWSRERRRSQKMVMPREKNPKRPTMTDEMHEALIDQSPNWRFDAVMELCRETMHRRNSVRLLQWDDVDLRSETVQWRGEFDKNGLEIVAPLTPRAVEVLRGIPRHPGSPWVFFAEEDPAQPVSRHTLDTWLKRAKERAGIDVERLGFHGQKRAGVRRKEFRALPDPVREKLTGTAARTLDLVYDDVSVDEMREALRKLQKRRIRRSA